jgi:succinate dehydrogenase flavin-adding protein (antitoxin of CptAB toxin-antitoxin module)
MSNSKTRKNLIRAGRRKINWDSRRRGLNPQDLRVMGKSLR